MNMNSTKKSISRILISTGLVLGFAITPIVSNAQEYHPWEGSVAGATMDFGSHDALTQVRSLLNEGKIQDAVRISQKEVDSYKARSRSGEISQTSYNAYNALCISLTAAKRYDEAMEACNTAISQSPSKWQAINSRGSLHFKTGKYADALQDYQTALNKAPKSVTITRVLEHNVKLSKGMVNSN